MPGSTEQVPYAGRVTEKRPAAHGEHPLLPVPPVADRRGLTATGAVLTALGAGLLGATIDVVTGSGLRTTFGALFTLGCAAAAYKVHREDLLAAVVIPPLVYVTLGFLAALGRATGAGGSFLKQQILELFSALVLSAPALVFATGAAALVAFLRWRLSRMPVTRRR